MANISVITNQNIIDVTTSAGITVTTPEGQVIDVTVPNSSVDVTTTTNDITVLTSGTLNINSSGVITSVNGDTGPVVVLDTDNIAEGSTNLYYTTARANTDFDSRLATKTTTNLSEGTNLYYTNARADARVALGIAGIDFPVDSVNGQTNTVVLDTDDIAEGTNKYFSQTLARQSLSAGTGISYDNSTGVITNTSINTDTTYTQNASSTTGGANLNLVGSDSTIDSVKFAGAGATTITRTDADTITVSSTDTNTTYTQNFSSTSGGTNLNLVGSDSVTDTVKFADGTGVTVSYTDADTATISIGQSVGTSDSPSFAGGTFGNITVGVATDNTIASTDTNGNIILDPNGSGDIILTLANGGNLTNSHNYVYGAIRNSTTESNGDVWSISSGTGPAYRGISLDNSVDTTKRPGIAIRSYGISSGAPRTGIILEGARGTAASPTNLNNGDVIGDILANGYTSTGWASDQVAIVPGIARFVTTEAWNDGLNKVGTGFRVLLQPTATTLTTTSVVTALEVTPTQATVQKQFNVVENRATSNNNFALTNFVTQRFSGGNYSPTQSGDPIGQFKFNGNALSGPNSGVPSGPGANISAVATELWSNTANGTQFNFTAIKTGTINSYDVIRGTPDLVEFNATNINLNTYTGSTPIIGNNINYNRVYGQWQYNTTVTPAASNTAYVFPIGTQDYANIATVGSTSRIIPGAAGMYKLQFSVQIDNSDNGTEHTAYIWLRQNGVDVPASMGRVTVPKGGATIASWDNMLQSTNTTDYWELAYAVDDHNHISFPFYASTAFGPSTAALFTTLVPVGA